MVQDLQQISSGVRVESLGDVELDEETRGLGCFSASFSKVLATTEILKNASI
jgi:hypothetical protein